MKLKYEVSGSKLVETFCKAMKDSVLIDSPTLAKALDINPARLGDGVHFSVKGLYSMTRRDERGNVIRVWGNPRTVAQTAVAKDTAIARRLSDAQKAGAAAV